MLYTNSQKEQEKQRLFWDVEQIAFPNILSDNLERIQGLADVFSYTENLLSCCCTLFTLVSSYSSALDNSLPLKTCWKEADSNKHYSI